MRVSKLAVEILLLTTVVCGDLSLLNTNYSELFYLLFIVCTSFLLDRVYKYNP